MTGHDHDNLAAPARASFYPAILQIFERALDSPLSAVEAYRRFRAHGGKSGPAAFYRALTALKDAGLLSSALTASGVPGYAIENEPGDDRLICTLCGRVQRVDNAELRDCCQRIAQQQGFEVVGVSHVIYGHCLRPDCVHFQRRTLPTA